MTRCARIATLVSLTLGLAACGGPPVLIPASAANQVEDRSTMAWAEDRGVRVWVDGAAWRGFPEDLGAFVTPVFIRIQNNSPRPLRLTYADMLLVGANGFEYRVLPPYSLTRQGLGEKPPREDDGQAGAQGLYWDRGWPYDYYDYGDYYQEWAPALPSRDMVRRAMPEGTLRAGGNIYGFVYFDRAYRARALVFRMRMVDADTGEMMGAITIPFLSTD